MNNFSKPAPSWANLAYRLIIALILASAFVLAFGGCAQYAPVVSAARVQAQQASDTELAVSEWAICNAATIGAWVRRYGMDPGKVDAWRELCATKIVSAPAKGAAP